MNNAHKSNTHMKFTKVREDELIADRIDRLYVDMAKEGKNTRNNPHVQEIDLRIEVLNRKINPEQLDSCMTFHGKKVGGWLRDACIAESLWLWCMRDDPYGDRHD